MYTHIHIYVYIYTYIHTYISLYADDQLAVMYGCHVFTLISTAYVARSRKTSMTVQLHRYTRLVSNSAPT